MSVPSLARFEDAHVGQPRKGRQDMAWTASPQEDGELQQPESRKGRQQAARCACCRPSGAQGRYTFNDLGLTP
jgi:hypothetical protein